MKRKIKIHVLCLMAFSFLIYSCAREEGIPVTANFSVQVINNDYTVPVKLQITNKTTGAESYEWSFEGATNTSSTERTPKQMTYNQPGVYKIKLNASNQDGNKDTKEIEIKIDAAMFVDFDWDMLGSNISPVSLIMKNKSLGATQYTWEFQGANPATSSQENPKPTFVDGGDHLIKLTIFNGKETYSIEKTLTTKPAMNIDFKWEVDAIDNDYEAPLLLHLKNNTSNAFSYEWNITGASPAISTAINPDIKFTTPGNYTIVLKASNDKETKVLEKQITIKPNTNLLSFKDVQLGVNTAHASVGCYFSSVLAKVIKSTDLNSANGSMIDFAFFGLNSLFSYNQFISPTETQNTAFPVIPNAKHSQIINSQELVGNPLSHADFENITAGNAFDRLNIVDSNAGKSPFNNQLIPRIVLFKTEDGRKGAIRIKNYISNGLNSYIIVDVKIQKEP